MTSTKKTLASVFPTGKLSNGATIIIPATPMRTRAEIEAALKIIADRPKPEKKAKVVRTPKVKVVKTFASVFPTGKLSNGATVIIPATPMRTRAEIEAALKIIADRPKPAKKARATKPKVVKTFEAVFPTGLNKKGTKIVIPISPTRTMEEIMKGPPPKKVAEAINTIVASVVAPAVAAATKKATRGKGKKTPLTTSEKKKRASDGRKKRAAEKKNDKK